MTLYHEKLILTQSLLQDRVLRTKGGVWTLGFAVWLERRKFWLPLLLLLYLLKHLGLLSGFLMRFRHMASKLSVSDETFVTELTLVVFRITFQFGREMLCSSLKWAWPGQLLCWVTVCLLNEFSWSFTWDNCDISLRYDAIKCWVGADLRGRLLAYIFAFQSLLLGKSGLRC